MKPDFVFVKNNYPRRNVLSTAQLFASIGWSDVLNKPVFADTCAIRVSIAILGAGVTIPGARMPINADPLKGKRIEPGQGKLSNILQRIWGAPEVYKSGNAARDGIGHRTGVVSFFRIHGGGPADGGHIDLIWPSQSRFSDCAMSCYFVAVEIWFWPLR